MSARLFATGAIRSTQSVMLAMDAGGEIKSINLMALGSVGEQEILLYVRKAADPQARLYARMLRGAYERADPVDNPLNLGVGDQILGVTTTDKGVEFIISGESDK